MVYSHPAPKPRIEDCINPGTLDFYPMMPLDEWQKREIVTACCIWLRIPYILMHEPILFGDTPDMLINYCYAYYLWDRGLNG